MVADSGSMVYNAGKMDALAQDLHTYKTQLDTEKTHAGDQATALRSNWAGAGHDAFQTKHGDLMTKLGDVITCLQGGINGVDTAKQHAFLTDHKIEDSFF